MAFSEQSYFIYWLKWISFEISWLGYFMGLLHLLIENKHLDYEE